jgi:thiamine-phosphate pyrophosphorylase
MRLFSRHPGGRRRRLRTARPFDPLVYLVIGTADLRTGSDLEAVAVAAARGGASLVQLREKGASLERTVELARALKRLLAPLGVPLIINDRAEAVLAADADGLHVGPEDLSVLSARLAIGRHRILGASAGTPEELRAIGDIDAVDYLGVGPVYGTATKADAGAAIGPHGLWALKASLTHDLPIVGIGGITADNAADCIKAGADGVAVVSAIAGAADPGVAARRIRAAAESARGERQAAGY